MLPRQVTHPLDERIFCGANTVVINQLEKMLPVVAKRETLAFGNLPLRCDAHPANVSPPGQSIRKDESMTH